MRSLARLAIAGCLLACATSAQEQAPKVEPGPDAPSGKILEWTSAEGKPYWYRLPKTLDKSKPPNLLLMLHGTGLKWGWAFWNYPIEKGPFRKNDIVVAPEGMTPGGDGIFNFTQGKADRDHIAGLITYFKKRLPVGKVYVYGHSQGAFFAYWFAGERPDLVDGIVAHAGNVLDNVKHPKAAKENVAIAILHGRADAVVPVDCAYATEKVYKEQGYKKIKLYVVEKLTPESGHWPLPDQVAEMLAWLDQVSADSARGAVEVALNELKADSPDLSIVVSAAIATDRLLKTAKPDEQKDLQEKQTAIQALIATLAQRHDGALFERAETRKTLPPHGAWAAHFRAANRALDASPIWQRTAKDCRERATAQEKAVLAATAKLEKSGAAALGEAVKALETGFLAPGYDELLMRSLRLADSQPKGLKADDAAKLKALAEARRADAEAGAASYAAVTRELATAFRTEHPTWFE